MLFRLIWILKVAKVDGYDGMLKNRPYLNVMRSFVFIM